MLVLVLLGLVIRAHGCEQQYVGQPLEAVSAATAGAAAAAQRSMDLVQSCGLPPRVGRADALPMAALCFVLISEFWTLESRDVVELAYASCPRHPNGNGRLGRRMYA